MQGKGRKSDKREKHQTVIGNPHMQLGAERWMGLSREGLAGEQPSTTNGLRQGFAIKDREDGRSHPSILCRSVPPSFSHHVVLFPTRLVYLPM